MSTTLARRLIAAAFIATGLALGGAGIAAAAPLDPAHGCLGKGGHPIDCCVGGGGTVESGSGPGTNGAGPVSDLSGTCTAPKTRPAGPGTNGAGPAAAGTPQSTLPVVGDYQVGF
jgi:hypothetical protein